jgi:cytochrome c-type biogenesis protein CcmH/NrfG
VTSPLRHRPLRLLVTGSTVSLLGDGIYAVAMAVAALRTAVAVAPDDLEAHLKLARALHLAGDSRAAADELQAAARIDPGSPALISLAETVLPR